MKISEAMRIGAAMTRPVTGRYLSWNVRGRITKTCAVGAVLVGYHATLRKCDVPYNSDVFNLAMRIRVKCPECPDHFSLPIIDHLYEQHDWTRERIADWLVESGLDREIEAKEEKHEESPVAV
jgi:hypothetical protein